MNLAWDLGSSCAAFLEQILLLCKEGFHNEGVNPINFSLPLFNSGSFLGKKNALWFDVEIGFCDQLKYTFTK